MPITFKKKRVKIKHLTKGDTFKYKRRLYLTVEGNTVINLTEAEWTTFDPDTYVQPTNLTITEV